jgi:predicted nucleic acid-binding protein
MRPVVLDTNVIVAALRSCRGASFEILERLGQGWVPLISVPLNLEYEAVCKREAQGLNIPAWAIDAIIRAFCFVGLETDVYFRVRPFLRDTADEFIFELAVAEEARAIVTHNIRHFEGVEKFGVSVLTPREFLRTISAEDK